MTLSTTDLEQLLSLALSALRAHSAGAPVAAQAAADVASVLTPNLPAVDQRTMGQWLDVHLQQLVEKGYAAQTLKNRTSNIAHVRRIWGARAIASIVEHCRASAKPGATLLRKAGGGPIEMSSLSARFCEHIKAVLGDKDPGMHRRPSLHEVRSLAARLYRAQGVDVQTLLGHKHAEMTAIYEDDRGLSRNEWKRVAVATDREEPLHGTDR